MFSASLILLNTSPTIFPSLIGRPAAVTGVKRRIDLNPHAAGRIVVTRELNPRDDPVRDRKIVAARRITVHAHVRFQLRQAHPRAAPPAHLSAVQDQ